MDNVVFITKSMLVLIYYNIMLMYVEMNIFNKMEQNVRGKS